MGQCAGPLLGGGGGVNSRSACLLEERCIFVLNELDSSHGLQSYIIPLIIQAIDVVMIHHILYLYLLSWFHITWFPFVHTTATAAELRISLGATVEKYATFAKKYTTVTRIQEMKIARGRFLKHREGVMQMKITQGRFQRYKVTGGLKGDVI